MDDLLYGAGSLHRIPTAGGRRRAIETAFAVGFRAFDVAPAYGNGVNEVELGIALRDKRNACEINTKYGIPIGTYGRAWRHAFAVRRFGDRLTGGSSEAYRRREFSPAELERSLDRSLERLQTDYVDALFLHEPVVPLAVSLVEDVVACGERLKTKGKIRSLGVAGPRASLALVPSIDGFDVVQTRWGDLDAVPVAARDKALILYGAYRAYREGVRSSGFPEFVEGMLREHPNTRVIVASTNLATIASLGSLLR